MTRRTQRTTVLIADDHAVVADGLRKILGDACEIVGVVYDGSALVEETLRLKPEAVITDIAMPELNGLQAAHRILEARPHTRVIILTGIPDLTLAARALRNGAAGYVLKASAGEELLTALHETMNGRTYVTPRLAGGVFQNLMEGCGRGEHPLDDLTPRERQVLEHVAEGHTIKHTAEALKISPRTVEFHKENLQDKVGLHTNAELARYAQRHGVVRDLGAESSSAVA